MIKSIFVTILGSTSLLNAQLSGNETCESTDQIIHFDWDELMGDETLKPAMTHSLDVEQSSLSLIVDVELAYVGLAYADDHTYGFGTTYVLDFEDYNAESDNIRLPGNCQNRMAADFGGDWNTLWTYSHTPAEDNHLANESTLSYPPQSDFWDLTIDDDCTPVKYHGEFSWSELRDCSSYDGSLEYTVVQTDANWINLTGVFYVNLVSPLAHYTDTGYYRVYQMLSAPFVIAVRNSVNIISSVGINLFTMSIIAVYKEDLETDFRLIVLTEAADFLMLESPELLSAPTLNPDTIDFSIQTESVNEGCLVASANLCSQLWEIYADNVTCPPTNFSGQYAIEFDTVCNPDASQYENSTALCTAYIDTYGTEVGLTADLEWLDEVCDPEVFIITFDGTMSFYNSSAFDFELGPTEQYGLGETAYVEISIDMPDNAYEIFDVNLDNVWVCTTSPDNEPLTVSDQNLGTGGCLSPDIDADSLWHIVQNGVDNDLTNGGDVVLYTPYANGTMRFSFFVDSSISRVNLYIQAQVSIELVAGGERRRMQMRYLLQADDDEATSTQIRHFDGAAGINPNPAVAPEQIADDVDLVTETGAGPNGNNTTWLQILSGVGVLNVCLVGICIAVFCLRGKRKEEMNAADILKAVQGTMAQVPNTSQPNTPAVTTGGHGTPASQESGVAFPDTSTVVITN